MIAQRCFLIEFGCVNWSGHRCNTLADLSHALKKRSIDSICGININACKNVVSELNSHPIFTMPIWPQFSQDKLSGEIESFLEAHSRGLKDFSNFFSATNGITAHDTIIFCTASEVELIAFSSWVKTIPPEKHPKVIINLALPQYFDEKLEPNLKGRLLRTAVKTLRGIIHKDKIKFYTYTQKMAKAFSPLIHETVEIVPNPLRLDIFSSTQSHPIKEAPIKVVALGEPKGTKGPETIFHIAQAMLDEKIKFYVQNWPPTTAPLKNVKVLPIPLSQHDYINIIKSSDITILPYDPAIYKACPSSNFDQSVAAGHIILASQDTTMSEIINIGQAVGKTFPFLDNEKALYNFRKIIQDFESYKKLAKEKANDWVELQGVEVYLDCLSK